MVVVRRGNVIYVQFRRPRKPLPRRFLWRIFVGRALRWAAGRDTWPRVVRGAKLLLAGRCAR